MNLTPRHLQGLHGRELAVGVVLTPVLIPFWILFACVRPVVWAYDEIMTRAWGGR